ncbi:hypothetical protein [Methylomonas koyamae]|nr:hypothetical protein [Methylomonas koyamae]
MLKNYSRQREQDHGRTIGFTDNLVKIFSNGNLPLAAVRNAGLTLLDHLPFAKQMLARHAMGLANRLPKIGDRE